MNYNFKDFVATCFTVSECPIIFHVSHSVITVSLKPFS